MPIPPRDLDLIPGARDRDLFLREQRRLSSEARYVAERRLKEAHWDEWRELYTEETAKRGVTARAQPTPGATAWGDRWKDPKPPRAY